MNSSRDSLSLHIQKHLHCLELIYKTTKTILEAAKRDDDLGAHLHAGNRKRMVDELACLKKKALSFTEDENDGNDLRDWRIKNDLLLGKINDLDRDIVKRIDCYKKQISDQISENFKMRSHMKKYNASINRRK